MSTKLQQYFRAADIRQVRRWHLPLADAENKTEPGIMNENQRIAFAYLAGAVIGRSHGGYLYEYATRRHHEITLNMSGKSVHCRVKGGGRTRLVGVLPEVRDEDTRERFVLDIAGSHFRAFNFTCQSSWTGIVIDRQVALMEGGTQDVRYFYVGLNPRPLSEFHLVPAAVAP